MLSARQLSHLLISISLLLSTAAHAELSADIGLATEYMRDGISETRGKQALQAGAGYVHSSGLYAGAWGSEIKHKSDNAHSEWDLYAGISRSVNADVSFDIGLSRYTFHGDYEAQQKNYTDRHIRMTLYRSVVLGWRRTPGFLGSGYGRQVLETSYTLHTRNFDFEFYAAQHRYMDIDDDYNFGNENRDGYWHFRVGVERTYKQYDYRLSLQRTNLTSDFDAGTTFLFSLHRYFDF